MLWLFVIISVLIVALGVFLTHCFFLQPSDEKRSYLLHGCIAILLGLTSIFFAGEWWSRGSAALLTGERLGLGVAYTVIGQGQLPEILHPKGWRKKILSNQRYWVTVIGPDGYVYTYLDDDPIPPGKTVTMILKRDGGCYLATIPDPETIPETAVAEASPHGVEQ